MFAFAQHLFAAPIPAIQDETRWRAVIGRAYYACWLTARDRLWGTDGRPTPEQERRFPRKHGRPLGSHEQVIEALGINRSLPSLAKRKRQKDQLGSLKALRNAADYRHSDTSSEVRKLFTQYSVSTWAKLAEQALVIATEALPELQTHPKFI
jgi:hypothetical protein